MRNLCIKCLALICIVNLCACATANLSTPLIDQSIVESVQDSIPIIDSAQFAQPIAIPPDEQIYALSEEQTSQFLRYYNAKINADDAGHVRVYKYLKDVGTRFTYADITNNAETTLRTESGNCMSLAILTSALARLVNIEIKYQMVNRVPIYQEYGSVIFNAKHIRSEIFEPVDDQVLGQPFWRKKAIIDYYPSRYTYASNYVDEQQFIGMYYQNLAAEALGEDDFSRSYWLLQKSLEHDPDNADSINSMAVLARRVGDMEVAEALYKYGIKHAQNKISLLKNYHILLKMQGRTEDADRVAVELAGMDNPNPFDWLHAANEAYDESDYRTALRLYEKVTDIASYLHQGYFGIAKSQYQLGNFKAANSALKQAHAESYDERAKLLYEAKMTAMSSKPRSSKR